MNNNSGSEFSKPHPASADVTSAPSSNPTTSRVINPEEILSEHEMTKVEGSVDTSLQVTPVKTIDLTQPEAKPEVKDTPERPDQCPACGIDIDTYIEAAISDEDKERWMRHILGESRFVKEYDILCGRAKVTFRTRIVAENDEIYAVLGVEQADGKLEGISYTLRLNRLLLTFSLAALEFDNEGNKYPEVTEAAYKGDLAITGAPDHPAPAAFDYPVQAAYATIFKGKGEAFMDALLQRQGEFERLITALMQHGNDPDFWKPTEHAV